MANSPTKADLHHLTISEAATLLQTRAVSARELAEHMLARIESVDPVINSYVTVTSERALADAVAADTALAGSESVGPLCGVPIALKDIYHTAGILTTGGSHLYADRVPRADSVAAALLREAGTVLLGKLVTHEFAFGGPSWDLPVPPARNPWNPERFTGGSSSGSGAAMAGGLALGTLGTDTAGSIRMPAFFCGLTGLKPTYGRVSRRGVDPLGYSLDHCGPITWTARDAALMMQAIAGHDPQDPASVDVPVPDYVGALSGDIRGLRIGLIRHFYDGDDTADPVVQKAMEAAVEAFGSLGAMMEPVTLSPLQDYHACNMLIMMGEAMALHEPHLRATPEKYGEIFRDRMMLTSVLNAQDYVQATRLRRMLASEMAAAFDRFDVLLTAGGWGPAPPIDQISPFYVFQRPLLTSPTNVSGLPTAAVCNGFSEDGLPVGMQIIGRPFDEATVLKVADAFEMATPWRDRRPTL
jgi:aspartyl-tRNA(Asn)/glutamyl-tRNA(Gln) amidotransferase subunit A